MTERNGHNFDWQREDPPAEIGHVDRDEITTIFDNVPPNTWDTAVWLAAGGLTWGRIDTADVRRIIEAVRDAYVQYVMGPPVSAEGLRRMVTVDACGPRPDWFSRHAFLFGCLAVAVMLCVFSGLFWLCWWVTTLGYGDVLFGVAVFGGCILAGGFMSLSASRKEANDG